jgi:hypothetical protein
MKMANDTAQAANLETTTTPEGEWDEDRIETAIAQLQEMHIQVSARFNGFAHV